MNEESTKTSNKPMRDEKGRLLPGQGSLNPNGRPKFSLVSILREQLQEVVVGEKEGKAKELIKTAIASALKGDTQMLRDIINRIDGMPKQSLEHTGAEGEPIQVSVINFKDSAKDKQADEKE